MMRLMIAALLAFLALPAAAQVEVPTQQLFAEKIAGLEARIDALDAEVAALVAGGPAPQAPSAGSTGTPADVALIKAGPRGLAIDGIEGFVRMLDPDSFKNEVLIASKVPDPAAVRLQARHDTIGKVSFDLLLPDGRRCEMGLVAGRLGKIRRGSLELVAYLNDGGGCEDANMHEAGGLYFDRDGRIRSWVGSDPRNDQISYADFGAPAVPDGIAAPPGGATATGGPGPISPGGAAASAVNLGLVEGIWRPVTQAGQSQDVRLVKSVTVTGQTLRICRTQAVGSRYPYAYVTLAGVGRIYGPREVPNGCLELPLPDTDQVAQVEVICAAQDGTCNIRDF